MLRKNASLFFVKLNCERYYFGYYRGYDLVNLSAVQAGFGHIRSVTMTGSTVVALVCALEDVVYLAT